MAMGLKTNFNIDNPFIYSGYTEMLTQFSSAFNEQSGGAIRLTSQSKRGDFDETAFFQNISGLVRRRDPSADTAVADKNVDMATMNQVKLNRGVGPIAQSYDSFRKIGSDVGIPSNNQASGINELDFVVGRQTAKAVQVEMVNVALLALRTALRAQAALLHDNGATTADDKIISTDLVKGLSKMGDAAASKIGLWVMHSKQYYDLVESQITSNLDGTTGFVLASASPVTLNRPVLVIDSPSLVVTDGVTSGIDSYLTLGLGGGAVEIEDTENMMLATQLITGNENLGIRIQGEYAYNVGVLGFDWDVANGGANPSDAALGTATNWDKQFADVKDLGGVVIETA
jgi:hypothetical protein